MKVRIGSNPNKVRKPAFGALYGVSVIGSDNAPKEVHVSIETDRNGGDRVDLQINLVDADGVLFDALIARLTALRDHALTLPRCATCKKIKGAQHAGSCEHHGFKVGAEPIYGEG